MVVVLAHAPFSCVGVGGLAAVGVAVGALYHEVLPQSVVQGERVEGILCVARLLVAVHVPHGIGLQLLAEGSPHGDIPGVGACGGKPVVG